MKQIAVFLVQACVAITGCSAIVKEVDVSCSTDDDCVALNAKADLENACEYYQCAEPSKGCQKLPRDQDNDKYLDQATCANMRPVGELDCDDSDRARHPHAIEACDRIDNDCDRLVDEGVWGPDAGTPNLHSLPSVTWLSTAGPSDWGLPVLTTTRNRFDAVSDLYVVSANDAVGPFSLQQDTTKCTKRAEMVEQVEGCTLHEPAIALISDAWLAMGIDVAGCAGGTVRFASSARNDDSPVRWDGDRSSKGNLRIGVSGGSSCASPGARAPTLTVSTSTNSTTAHGLALWRASPANVSDSGAAPLLGLGLSITVNPNTSPMVGTLSSEPPASLRDDGHGVDPARALPWRQGFLVAYDVPEGLELAYVSRLEGGVERAFNAASRLSYTRPGARHVALSVGQVGDANQRDSIALAWRVPAARGWTLHFAAISPSSPERLGSSGPLAPLTIASEAPISDGPALAHVGRGVALDEDGNELGGWFVLWIEGGAAGGTLKVARVRRDGDGFAHETRGLDDAPGMKHLFAHALNDDVRYGFVSGDAEVQQLNVGSLVCGQ